MSSPDLSTLQRQRAHYRAVRERLHGKPPTPPASADGRHRFPVELFVQPPMPIRRHSPVPETRVDFVIRLVCQRFGVSREAMVDSKSREPRICWPRQIAMYLLKNLSSQPSYNMVARWLGGMDHTTILHGLRKVRRAMDQEPPFAGVINQMQAEIERSS